MQHDANHELDSLREIKDILMRLWPGKIVMGTFTVFVSTKYGDVKVMTDKTEFPYSSRYLFRKDMPVEEYCSSIVSDIEDYNMSLNEMKNMIETAYKGKIQFQLAEYKCHLRLQTTNGEAFFNRELVHFSGYGQKFYRKDKSLEKFCSFIISGIDKYSVVLLKNKLAEICTCDIELDERNHLIHLKTEYGNAIADAGTVRYSDYPFVLHRSRMNTTQFAEFIADGIHKYSLEHLKGLLSESYPNEAFFDKDDHCVRVRSEYGDVIADWQTVRFPLNPYIYYRKDRAPEKFISFILSGIEKFSRIRENVISEISPSDALGKNFEAIHSEWLRLMNLDIANSGMSDMEVTEQMEALCDTFAETVMNQTKIYADIFQTKIDEINVKKRMDALGRCYIKDNRIDINVRTIALPPVCVRETILHEICHLFIPNHNLGFYRKLEEMCHTVGLIRNYGYVVPELGNLRRYSVVPADENDWNNYERSSAIISSWISKREYFGSSDIRIKFLK